MSNNRIENWAEEYAAISEEIRQAAENDEDLWVFARDVPGRTFRRYSYAWQHLVETLRHEGRLNESDAIHDYGFRKGLGEV